MARKQIINPLVGFGQRSIGPYANRIGAVPYARHVGLGDFEPPVVATLYAFAADGQEVLKGLVTGTGSMSFARASDATVTDFEPLVKTALANELRFEHGRRVENLWPSADGSDTPSTQIITVVSGSEYQLQIGAESTSGATAVCSGAFTGTLTADGLNVIAFDAAKTAVSTSLTVTITGNIRKIQLEDVTGQSNQNPSEYVSVGVESGDYHGVGVDGVRYYEDTNSLEVIDNVVSEIPIYSWTVQGDGTYTEIDAARQWYKITEDGTNNGSEFLQIDVPEAYLDDDAIAIWQCSFNNLGDDDHHARLYVKSRANNNATLDVNLTTGAEIALTDVGSIVQDYGFIDEGALDSANDGWFTLWIVFDVESGTPSFLDCAAYAVINAPPWQVQHNFADDREAIEMRDPYLYEGTVPILPEAASFSGQEWYALSEPAATNECPYSKNLSVVFWQELQLSTATDGTLGIDGLDAYLLTNTGDSDDVSNYGVIDNSNLAWITETTAYTPGSAWSRFSHAFTTPAGCTSVRLYVARTVDAASYKFITIDGLTALTEYTFSWYALAGSAVNNVYVDGVQLEVGGVATSIIHTAGSAATRTVDDGTPFAQVSGNVDETKGMLVFDLNSSVAAADLPATTAIVSLADAVNSLFRLEAAADELKSFDGTNTASDSLAFAADNKYRFAGRWSADDSEFQVGYRDITGAGSWQWGTAQTFDGAYVVGTDINMFFSGPSASQRIKNLRIYDSDQGTGWIEANF